MPWHKMIFLLCRGLIEAQQTLKNRTSVWYKTLILNNFSIYARTQNAMVYGI